MHDPGTADRLHVDLALPALAGGVLHIGVGGDDRVEYRGLQFEDALKGRVQMDAGGRVGGVRFQLELRVGCLVRKVERQRRVGRAGVHGKGADRLLLVRREQCEAGGEDAEKGNLKKRLMCSPTTGSEDEEGRPIAGVYPYFGGGGMVLVESVNRDLNGGVGRLDVD